MRGAAPFARRARFSPAGAARRVGAMNGDSAAATKDELRTALRARRDGMTAAARGAACAELTRFGAAALRERAGGAAVVSAYWPMRSEADPRALARLLAAAGARLALPAFVGRTMLFRAWERDDALVPAGFQTSEPPASAPELAPTLVLAPLLGFDGDGNRLGWGKGYYDTALAALDAAAARGDGVRPFVCGIAFACQEVPRIPTHAHDRRLDAVVTELGFRAW